MKMTKTVLAARLASLVPELAKDSLLNRERLIFGMLWELECEDKKRLDWLENKLSHGQWTWYKAHCSLRQAIDTAINKE